LGTITWMALKVRSELPARQLPHRMLTLSLVYKTEAELGTAIKESGVARDKLFVTTKVDKANMYDIESALKASLQKLQLDYVDL
jgi:diketogulonate reductase-like aldo/keto reductase